MWWRGWIAAYKGNLLLQWPYLPSWHKAIVIAVVEEDVTINNLLNG